MIKLCLSRVEMISDGVLRPVEDDCIMYQFGHLILLFICSSCYTGASAKIIPESRKKSVLKFLQIMHKLAKFFFKNGLKTTYKASYC